MNRIYNVYEVISSRDMVSGPCTQIILCKEHAKRYKHIAKKDPTIYVYKKAFGSRSYEPCTWCENPEEFNKLEKELK